MHLHLDAVSSNGRESMCRSIKTLRRPEGLASNDEIEAAALQFVRKVSGYNKPSQKNEAAFRAAVSEITAAAERLLQSVAKVPA
jgi:hypothetical protein